MTKSEAQSIKPGMMFRLRMHDYEIYYLCIDLELPRDGHLGSTIIVTEIVYTTTTNTSYWYTPGHKRYFSVDYIAHAEYELVSEAPQQANG